MSTIQARSPSPVQASTVAGASALARRGLAQAIDLVLTWSERAYQRRRLQALTQRDLHDLGLTMADVELESSKPFWRV
jgi:uncharacterized protein YjiS (DUF1127 family)